MADATVDLRPRSTGEILDDAWRLALADASPLVLYATLFLVPAFCAVLLLLARPEPAGPARFLLPALAAVLLPLTGVGSGACQELFRRRVEDRPAGAIDCLRAALRHGLEHAAARAAVLVAVVAGLFLLVMPGLTAWAAATPVHALIAAGRGRSGGLGRELRREAAFDPGKAAAVTFSRLPLLLFAAVNLHLLGLSLLWVADNLAGFDTALLAVEVVPLANPVYTAALLMLSWLLLAPYFEAANFLLHLDTRTRQEGLDLFYRVQRVFPSGEAAPAGRVVALVVALAGLLLAAGPARADEPPRPTPEQVKSLLRREGPPGRHGEKKIEEKKEEKKREKKEVERDDPQPRNRRGGGVSGPALPAAGLTVVGWTVLGGLAAAVLVLAFMLFLQARRGPRTEDKPKVKPARQQESGPLPLPENRSAEELWREAESLAGAGQFREAVRFLYLAVLFGLDRKRLLRYEATRTNGEYVRQVRLAENAPPDLHAPFGRLTALFERKWYGERTCDADEYEAGKALAWEVRELTGAA
jgi:hypothetical protein